MTESHDPWVTAREATRADVQAVFAPRVRTCPACGHEQTAPGRTCEVCGADFVVVRRKGVPRRILLAIAAVLLVAGGLVAVIVPALRSDAADTRRADARRQERLEAAERARLRADSRPFRTTGPGRRAGEDPLVYRARLVSAGQAFILADARGRAREGTIDGPVRGTTCYPYPRVQPRRALEADPSVPRGRYQCIAYKKRFALPALQGKARTGILGVPYWLVIDYGSGAMAACKVTPKAGEGGRSLAVVPVPVPCRDPLRRG
jgi:hypothetical protein